MTKAFDQIMEGMTEALAIARGETQPYRLHVPQEINVPAIRAKAHMSQDRFASTFGFTIHQIRQWEQGRSRPLGALRAYLMLIDKNPRAVWESLHSASGRPRNDGNAAA